MSNVEKTFVIPTFGVTPVRDIHTLMNPLSLAVAKETGQFDTVTQERRSAFVEILEYLSCEINEEVFSVKPRS